MLFVADYHPCQLLDIICWSSLSVVDQILIFDAQLWYGTLSPVSRIQVRDPMSFWSRDPGWVKKSGSGSGMNDSDNISLCLETIFWVKILKFCDADPE
jgi:hypothetical protein